MNTGSVPKKWYLLNNVLQLSVTPSQRLLGKSAELITAGANEYKQVQFPPCFSNFEIALTSLYFTKYIFAGFLVLLKLLDFDS